MTMLAPTNQKSISAARRLSDEDAAAFLAVDERVGRLVLDAVDLHCREVEVASAAEAAAQAGDADATELLAQRLVVLELIAGHTLGGLRALGLDAEDLAVELRLRLGEHG